jgi:hypothetical protein
MVRRVPGRLREAGRPMSGTFAMRVFAATYWLLVLVFVYILEVIILPSPDAGSFLPLIAAFLGLFVAAAATATFARGATRRGWVWLVLLVPAVLFLVMNAPYIAYPLAHPADSGFAALLPLLIGTFVLAVSGFTAFREARDPARVSRSGVRARVAVAVVAGLAAGSVATGVLAAASGGGSPVIEAAPTVTATLVAKDVQYLTTTYSMKSSDVLGLFVTNHDSTGHSFDIDSLGIHVAVPANSTVFVAVKPTGPGTLQFYCAIPGHRRAGMVGVIDVSG